MRLAVVILVLLAVAYLSVGAFLGYRAYKGPAAHSMNDFLALGRDPATRVLVINIGDSLTQGTFSADYVGALRRHLKRRRFEFVNAGANGAKVLDALERSREVLACKPDAITILIGTNDVHAYLDAKERDSTTSLSDAIATYRTNLESLVSALRSGTTAKIAILSIPPLGQDFASTANKVVEQYNRVVRQVCDEKDVTCLPLFETARSVIASHHSLRSEATAPSRDLSRSVAIRRFFLFRNWDQISEKNGFVIHTDAIHLNGRGAQLVSDLIENWLTTDIPR